MGLVRALCMASEITRYFEFPHISVGLVLSTRIALVAQYAEAGPEESVGLKKLAGGEVPPRPRIPDPGRVG